MGITLKIRFSIPSTLMMDEFKRQLTQSGFLVEKITPALPCGQEITAYVMTGVFRKRAGGQSYIIHFAHTQKCDRL